MMRQSTLAVGGFDTHGKTIRKASFLARMDKLVPWAAIEDLINWFNLADQACEDALDIERSNRDQTEILNLASKSLTYDVLM